MISTKKLATIGAAAALLALSAGPVFAHSSRGGSGINVHQENNGSVDNTVVVASNTGLNATGGRRHHGGSSIKTGDATTFADVATIANSNLADVNSCGCEDEGESEHRRRGSNSGIKVHQENNGSVDNDVWVVSNTGLNYSKGKIRTGDAYTDAGVLTVANTNVATVN